jgi:hypothetical protein
MAESVQPLAMKNSKGETFLLHSKVAHLRGGKPTPIYFFIKNDHVEREPNNATPEPALPEGYAVRETESGVLLPYKKEDGQAKGGEL